MLVMPAPNRYASNAFEQGAVTLSEILVLGETMCQRPELFAMDKFVVKTVLNSS